MHDRRAAAIEIGAAPSWMVAELALEKTYLEHGRKVLVVVPNAELRRSIEFTVEAEGYEIESHAGFPTVFATHKANGFDCAVVDEDAVDAGQRNLIEFARIAGSKRPVVVLVDRTVALAETVPFQLLRKPLLGPALIEAIGPNTDGEAPVKPST